MRYITSYILSALLVLHGSYNSSLVVLDVQAAHYKLCKNRLALVISSENIPAGHDTSEPSPSDQEPAQALPGCVYACSPQLEYLTKPTVESVEKKLPLYVAHLTAGFASQVLRPPRVLKF